MAVTLKADIMLISVDRTASVRLPTLALLVGCALITLLASLQPLASWLAYDQDWLETAQFWRPLTASLAQLHLKHWLLNQWGLVLMALLVPVRLGRADLLAFLFVWLAVSVSLPITGYSDYAGLSGVIYGWLIWSLLTSPHYPPWLLLTVAAAVSLKVALENLPGMNQWLNLATADFLNAEIAVRAHLWGLVSGWLACLFQWWRQRS